MQRCFRLWVILAACISSVVLARVATAQESVFSGTLNLILANKNGFVIAADSRRSSTTPFKCHGVRQLYCDDSQSFLRLAKSRRW
jgi:hypothetical protein